MSPSPVLVLSADELRRAPIRYAVRDLVGGLKLVQLWGAMAWFDITQRYSRSVIGPFWLSLSLAIFVAGLGTTYGALFRIPLTDFLPYLTLGMLIWTFISTVLTEGTNVFVAAEVAVKQMPTPLSVHVYRVVWRALIMFAHNALVALLVLLVKPWALLTGLLPALLGMAILTVQGVGVAVILGTLGARFRDLPPLMQNFTSLLFFVTPILWKADDLGDRKWIALANPIYHLIEIVRAPLLGNAVSATSWAVALGSTLVTGLLAILLYARLRWRIPYWL